MTDFDPASFDPASIDPANVDANALAVMNRYIVSEFRNNEGRVGRAFEEASILLLHTIGARSGQPRLSPLAYQIVDDRIIISAAAAGGPRNPAWVYNLRAHSRVRIEVGVHTLDVVARELHGPERDDTFTAIASQFPIVVEYQAKTSRVIPLFELARL